MLKAKFIYCRFYSFDDKNGQHQEGYSMRCFYNNDIVKVSVDPESAKRLLATGITFGDDIELDVAVRGNFANYVYIAA